MSIFRKYFNLRSLFLAGFNIGFSIVAIAQNDYQYNPLGSFRLGYGFNKNDYTESYPISPFSFEEQTPNQSATSFLLNTELIYDEKTLRDHFHFDLKVSSKSLKYSASAKFNIDTDKNFSYSSLNILLEATTEFGKTILNNVKLTAEAERILNDPNDIGHKKFMAKYGTNFVSEQRNGVSVFTLITITNVSNEFRQEYGIKASGSLKLGIAKTTMSANLNKEIYQASKSNRIQYKVWGAGGEGIVKLADVFKNLSNDSDCLEAIRNTITDYIKTLDFSKSSPIGFKTASYNVIGLEAKDPWTEENEDRIVEIYNEYHREKAINNKISDLLSPENIYFQELLPIDKQKDLKNLQILTKQRISLLADLHKTTMKDPGNRDSIPQRLNINLDSILPRFPEFSAAYVTISKPYNGYDNQLDSDQLTSIKISANRHSDLTWSPFMSNLQGSIDEKLKGLVIYNDFNNKDYFKFITDIKIYKNGTLFLSFKNKINNDKELKLVSNDFRNSVYIVNFDKYNNFSTITSTFTDDYQKMVNEFNNGSQKRIDVDYVLVIQDVFQHEFQYPLLSDHRVGGKVYCGLKHLSKSVASTVEIKFDHPYMTDTDTLCAKISILIPSLKVEIPKEQKIAIYDKDPSLMIAELDDPVKFTYNKDNKYDLTIESPYKNLIKGYILEYYFIRGDGKESRRKKENAYMLTGNFKELLEETIVVDPFEFLN